MPKDRPVCVRMVLVGDKFVGKSSLGSFYVLGYLPCDLLQMGQMKNKTITKNGRLYTINLLETGSGDEYDRLRPLAYPNAEVMLLCFSVEKKESLELIQTKYFEEVLLHCPRVPQLLVACKTDLRETCEDTVSYDEGAAMVKVLGCRYYETSSINNTGVEECINAAIEEAESYKLLVQRKQRRCTVL
ncbi:rho-related protein racF2-like [Haliotis rufescens]|uniref:rho-related protein racF2-like n=1 Tax=Haliotis rufescens TaxID=6454 RepID=UPI00201F05DF|nr:rho-related protein racF2-like [Haliotis rufescens]XP_048237923.1 rho-related protein racF2-like [Haliotis rufescens]